MVIILTLLLIAGFTRAGKFEETPTAQSSEPSLNANAPKRPNRGELTPEELERLQKFEEENPTDGLVEEFAKDRAELVRPASPGWKPKAKGRRLKLTLVPKKTTYRVGERFWYRLELKNMGSEPAHFFEGDSFFKAGHAWMYWKFLVDERKVDQFGLLLGGRAEEFSPPGFERLTPEEKSAYVKRLNRESRARQRREQTLDVTLAPGETLVTRPWRYVDALEARRRRDEGLSVSEPVTGTFRELGEFKFREPGRHRVQGLYRPLEYSPPDEERLLYMESHGFSREEVLRRHEGLQKDTIGPLDSNVVAVDVAP